MRASPAMSRADSIRQTASIALTTAAGACSVIERRSGAGLERWAISRAQPRVPLAQLGRELLAEVVGLEDLANLDLAVTRHRVGAALDPLDGLVERRAPARARSPR